MIWVAMGLLLSMFCAGLHLLYRAYQIQISKRMALVTDFGGRPLNNPRSVATRIAIAKFAGGVGFTLMPIVLLVTQLPFERWRFPVAVVGGIYVTWLNLIAYRHVKRNP